jgi:hypothetical protein
MVTPTKASRATSGAQPPQAKSRPAEVRDQTKDKSSIKAYRSFGANNATHQNQKKDCLIHKLIFVVLVKRGFVQLLRRNATERCSQLN